MQRKEVPFPNCSFQTLKTYKPWKILNFSCPSSRNQYHAEKPDRFWKSLCQRQKNSHKNQSIKLSVRQRRLAHRHTRYLRRKPKSLRCTRHSCSRTFQRKKESTGQRYLLTAHIYLAFTKEAFQHTTSSSNIASLKMGNGAGWEHRNTSIGL